MSSQNSKAIRRLIVIACTAFAALMLVQTRSLSSGAASRNDSAEGEIFKLIATAFYQIEQIDGQPKELAFSAIHGMFRTLDPYTQFLDSEVFGYMQDQQKGSFYGIGISFDIRDNELLVVSAIEDTPAWKAGIKPGDVIIEIEGESTVGITNTEVLSKLRGEKGSKVTLTVRRPDVSDPMKFLLTRDKIALNSVRGGFKVQPGIGYARITEFSATTGNELKKMLEDFRDESDGLKGLIIDLRYNGGGLLAAAEDVCSLFLHSNDLIVSTRGRFSESATELRVKSEGEFSSVPLIVLVNEGSASSSEIVAAAIQDHDHGLVIGVPTHGKGLVGSQFPTRVNTAVQITTAQYYTPSNRFIQKPYDIPHRKSGNAHASANLSPFDSSNAQKAYFTDGGREVHGGGGITPDIKIEDPKLSSSILILENRGAFFNFAVKQSEKLKTIKTDFTTSDAMVQSFLDFCRSEAYGSLDNLTPEDSAYIRYAIKRELTAVLLGYEAGEEVRVQNMIQVKEALKLFPQISSLLTPKLPPPA